MKPAREETEKVKAIKEYLKVDSIIRCNFISNFMILKDLYYNGTGLVVIYKDFQGEIKKDFFPYNSTMFDKAVRVVNHFYKQLTA